MKGNNVAGISHGQLTSLISNINDIAENINKIFNKYEQIVDDNMKYFNSDIKEKFMSYHKNNIYYFSIFTRNILSYSTDLMNVKRAYTLSSSSVASTVKKI